MLNEGPIYEHIKAVVQCIGQAAMDSGANRVKSLKEALEHLKKAIKEAEREENK